MTLKFPNHQSSTPIFNGLEFRLIIDQLFFFFDEWQPQEDGPS